MKTTLAMRIRRILDEQGLKQTELAESLGVSINYISLLANGKKNNISLTLAKLIEALYSYPADWIKNGTESPDRSTMLREKAAEKIMQMSEQELSRLDVFITQISKQ